MTDEEIRQVAVSDSRVIVTKDSDFFEYYLLKGSPPRILLLEFGNIRNSALLAQFETHLQVVVNEFEAGAELLLFNYDNIARF